MAVLRPSSIREWDRSLRQVGYEGVVASVMPLALAETCARDEIHRSKVASKIASIVTKKTIPTVSYEVVGETNLGLHYDIGGRVAELSAWFNLSGECEWLLKTGGSRNKKELFDAIEAVGIETSTKIARSGTVVDLRKLDQFDSIRFSGVGGLVFAAGLQEDGDRIPAMHQVTGGLYRRSIAAYEDTSK